MDSKKHSAIDNFLFVMKAVNSWDSSIIAWALLRAVCLALEPALVILMPKMLIDSITTTDTNILGLAWQISLLSLALLTVNLVLAYGEKRFVIASNTSLNKFRILFTRKTMQTDYINLESRAGQLAREKAQRAINTGYSGASVMVQLSSLLTGHLTGLVLYAYLVNEVNALIFLILLGGAGLSFVAALKARQYEAVNMENYVLAEKRRYYGYYRIHDFKAAKDIRIFGMQEWLLQTMQSYINEQKQWLTRFKMGYFRSDFTTLIANALRDIVSYLYLTSLVLSGQITVGEYSLLFAAIAGISNWLSQILQDISFFDLAQREVGFLRDFLDLTNDTEGNFEAIADPVARFTAVPEIVFEKVCFSYPGSDSATLQSFSLSIKAGEKMALVGLNGAGKTTCIKLLLGLYQPTSGRILIDGYDISLIPKEHLYALFAPVFQDVWIVPFTIELNVSTQIKAETDRTRVLECCAKAGLADKIASLPHGIDTQLTRALDDEGVMLSGGEIQKLMLARALYKNAPIIVLDEPTAALDPLAEAELYNSYNRIFAQKTTLFISHRLASTQFCDRIALLSEGHVAELGSHEELISLHGAYAELFAIQSRYYRPGIVATDYS